MENPGGVVGAAVVYDKNVPPGIQPENSLNEFAQMFGGVVSRDYQQRGLVCVHAGYDTLEPGQAGE